MNSFLDMIVARKMEDRGHNIERTDVEEKLKILCFDFEWYKCKRCENIFVADKEKNIFLLTKYVDGVGAFFSGYICEPLKNPEMAEDPPNDLDCQDLIIKGIIK